MIVDGAQIRAGRALLGWHQTELAAASGVHWNWVRTLERMGKISIRARRDRRRSLERVEKAFEEAGVMIHSKPVGVYLK